MSTSSADRVRSRSRHGEPLRLRSPVLSRGKRDLGVVSVMEEIPSGEPLTYGGELIGRSKRRVERPRSAPQTFRRRLVARAALAGVRSDRISARKAQAIVEAFVRRYPAWLVEPPGMTDARFEEGAWELYRAASWVAHERELGGGGAVARHRPGRYASSKKEKRGTLSSATVYDPTRVVGARRRSQEKLFPGVHGGAEQEARIVNRAGPEVDSVTAPSAWASALVNGDESGLDDEDREALRRWAGKLAADGWYVVDVARDEQGDVVDPRFTWSYRLYGGTAGGGEVMDYVVHRQPTLRRAKRRKA